MQNRLKSKVAWMAIVALVISVFKNYGLFEPLGLTESSFREITDLIFATLISFGIFNDPTDSENF